MCVGISKEMFKELHPLTKYYLKGACSDEIKQIFGGSYTYELLRVKQFGFDTTNKYKTHIAISKGFKSRWEMEWAGMKKKHPKLTKKEYMDRQVRKRGFKDIKDYQNYLARKLGFKNLKEYRGFMSKRLRKTRKEQGLCFRCGGEKNPKFKLCSKCRKYFREIRE